MTTPPADLPVAPVDVLRERRSAKWRRFDDDVLPLFVAEMDFGLAPPITAALHAAIDRGDLGYGMPVPDLGTALAGFAAARWDWLIDPAAVTGTTDVGVGIVELLRVLTRPAEAVAFSPPVYPPFFHWPPEARAHSLEVPLAHTPDGWRLDLDAIEQAFRAHPAVYVLCNPHNPVGRVHSRDELTALADLARAYEVPVIANEIHAPLVLPGATFTPFLTVPGAAEIGISITSASKAWNLAGLKCASIVTASPAMQAVVERFPPDAAWRTGHLGVLASVAAYREGAPWLDQLLATLDRRRTELGELLAAQLPGVTWHPIEGTYLAWLDCTDLDLDRTARDLFLERGRVALEDGARFGAIGRGHVRLNLATSASILADAVGRMAAALT